MKKVFLTEKMAKTVSWALISGVIFLSSGLIAGMPLGPAVIATLLAVGLKTPFYWLHEHGFHWAKHRYENRRTSCRKLATAACSKAR